MSKEKCPCTHTIIIWYIHSFIPLACAECSDSLPFSGASSILPYHILFPATLLRQPCFHPPSLRPAIYFLVYLLVFLFPNSYTILFWEFYFLPFSVRVQTNVKLYDTAHYICKKADEKVQGNLPPQLGRISQYSGIANQPLWPRKSVVCTLNLNDPVYRDEAVLKATLLVHLDRTHLKIREQYKLQAIWQQHITGAVHPLQTHSAI